MKTTTNATSISPRRVRCFTLLLAVLALAVAPQSARAADQVPFAGNAEGAVTSVTPGPGGVVLTTFAEGDATLLGRYSREEELLLDPTTGTLTGEVVFTAANGDQIFCSFAGGFISPTTATGTYILRGGTGRFENATGSADFIVSTPDGIHFTVEFEGSLSSVGANKK